MWRSRSEDVDEMTSIATGQWTLVVWEEAGSAHDDDLPTLMIDEVAHYDNGVVVLDYRKSPT